MRLLWALPLALFTTAHAQANKSYVVSSEVRPPEVQKVLDQAVAMTAHVPNFRCAQKAVSGTIRNGRLKDTQKYTGEAITRRVDGDLQFTETFKGDPFKFAGAPKKPQAFVVTQGFLESTAPLSLRYQRCFDFTVTANRLDFSIRQVLPKVCKRWAGLKGFALLDPDGTIIHIERTVTSFPDGPPTLREDIASSAPGTDLESIVEQVRHPVPFVSVDFRPVTFNGHTYQIATHLEGERTHDGHIEHINVDYTKCEVFGGTMTLHAEP